MKKSLNIVAALSLVFAGAAANASMPATGTMVTQQVTIDKANDNRTLTVRYSGASVRTVELRCNGRNAAVRTVNPKGKSGETNFELDGIDLHEGENQIEVRVFDESGRLVASQRTTVMVEMVGKQAIFMAKPAPGATVQGGVELSVGFKVGMKNVYVSFFVDDDLKSIRNFAPYSYLWDTTKVDNGWHEVQAWVVDTETQTYKTERVKVYVNNPGGRTERRTTEAEAAPADPVAPVSPAAAAAPVPAPVNSLPGFSPRAGTKPMTFEDGTYMGLRSIKPENPAAQVKARPMMPTVPEPGSEPKAEAKPTKGEAPIVAPKTPVEAPVKAVPPAKVQAPEAHVEPTKPVNPPLVAVKAPRLAISYGTRLADRESFPVYVDGVLLSTDVPASIEDGIALTPFRFLYEHFGGKVGWENLTKTVSAEGPGGTLVISIGSSLATVSDGKISLERAAFLRNNRTIVPMSFFSQALGFDIAYDASSGHVIVTAARKS